MKSFNAGVATEFGVDPQVIDRIVEHRVAQEDSGANRFWIKNNPMLLLGVDAYGNMATLDSASYNPYGYALTGRFFGLNPIIGLVAQLVTGKRLYGTSFGSKVNRGELEQEILRISGFPNPAAQQALQAYLRRTAKFDNNNRPANTEAKLLIGLFGLAGLGSKFGEMPSSRMALANILGVSIKPVNTVTEYNKALENLELILRGLESEQKQIEEKFAGFKGNQAKIEGKGAPREYAATRPTSEIPPASEQISEILSEKEKK